MEQEQAGNRKIIKTRWIRLIAAIAAFLMLFSVGFWSIGALLNDTEFIEDQYTVLGTSEKMGISVPDLSRATSSLFDYIKNRRADIRVSVRRDGAEVDDLFYHPKEVVHMEEVRSLWATLTVFSVLGFAFAGGCFALIIFFGHRNTRLRSTGTGIIIGTLVFAGLIIAALLWAIADFESFWTVFHFLIFPSSFVQYAAGGMSVQAYNSLNWVFESDYAMIQMLGNLFPPLVLRAGIFFGVEIGVFLIAGILLNLRGRKLDQEGLDIVEVRSVTPEERYVPVEDAPDLVLQHRLLNASLKQKNAIMEELRKTPEQLRKEEEKDIAEEETTPAEERADDSSENEAPASKEENTDTPETPEPLMPDFDLEPDPEPNQLGEIELLRNTSKEPLYNRLAADADGDGTSAETTETEEQTGKDSPDEVL